MTSLRLKGLTFGLALLCHAAPSAAWELDGTRTIFMHTREGGEVQVGTVTFTPAGERVRFALALDHAKFTDYFLSMKEFKCLEGQGEVQCHVPYPYPHAGTVTRTDLRWLEHALLFLFKTQKEFGARLWNGLYYQLEVTDDGLVGTPQAIDLNLISAPPEDLTVPPYGAHERSEIDPQSRWFSGLRIR